MKNPSPRRAFLKKSVLATTGITLLSTEVIHALTSDLAPFEGYNPYAEEKTDIRKSIFGDHISISGTIFDESGHSPLAHAQVEVWHLSPSSTSYKHRAKLTCDESGNYHFRTDFPNKTKGKSARIYFKVSKGASTYFTELVLSPYGAFITDKHWKENHQLKNKVFPKLKEQLLEKKIAFNISLTNNF